MWGPDYLLSPCGTSKDYKVFCDHLVNSSDATRKDFQGVLRPSQQSSNCNYTRLLRIDFYFGQSMLFHAIVLASAATAPSREKHTSAGARIKQLPVAEPKALEGLSSRRLSETAGASHGSPHSPLTHLVPSRSLMRGDRIHG